MENLNIRLMVKESGVTYRRIAKEIGVSTSYLSRIMSKPLSTKNQLRIMNALEKLKSGGDPLE